MEGLWKNGIGTSFYVHRLVAEHFIPNPENKPEVNHINSIRDDPRIENLEWVTRSENAQHGYDYGFSSQEHRKALSDEEGDFYLLELLRTGTTLTNITKKKMGVSLSVAQGYITQSAKRLNKHEEVTNLYIELKKERNRKTAINKRRKILQWTKDGDIIAEHDSLTAAAKSLDKTSCGSISNALNGKNRQKFAYGYKWTWK